MGNASPYDPDVRSPGGGDNLYTASIVALDANTGKYVWHYQVNPRDCWDYDSTEQMTLADLAINGERRKVLMQAPKNGFFYVLDRETGKPISAGKIVKVTWADHIDLATGRPVEAKNLRYETGEITIWPGNIGGHNWQSMSFDPQTGLVYIPTMQLGSRFVRGKPIPHMPSFAGLSMEAISADANDGKGALLAWNPALQKAQWRLPRDFMWNGGTLATAGDLVFEGAADGYFSAYDAQSGARLWQFNAGLGINAAPISYAVNGRQFISVLVGYGGTTSAIGPALNVGWKFGRQPRRLLTFSLDGGASLPPSPPRDMSLHPVDNPALKLHAADIKSGWTLYTRCAPCHGLNLLSSGSPAPDLRESQIALNPEAVWSVVHDGALLQQGMPRFDELTRSDVRQIYAYIRAGARAALNSPQSAREGFAP
jgi:quinohemoprotein ethanol dehydrogenase